MNFLRNLLASIMGTLIALGIVFMVFVLFAALAGNQQKAITVKNGSVLQLHLTQPIKDYGGQFHFKDIEYKFEKYDGLNHILNAINYAKTDANIKGISIKNSMLMAGTAQIKAIRDALADFKQSGKFVYAYGDYYLQKDYYLASVADSVFLNPVGEMDFRGLSSEVLYFKDLQEKSGVKMEVIRHGKYKSAVEPYLENTMSDANRQQISELLESVWQSIVGDIAKSRNIPEEKLNQLADSLGARNANLALQNKFIDGLLYYDEYEVLLKRARGGDATTDIDYVEVEKYAEMVAQKSKKYGKDKVAVLFAQGEIFYGKGNQDYIGQGLLAEALKEAREDDKVKSIVLRIDSPGGSALASDIIWREIEITKKVKPVVVSMGNLAASGGYYIACGANKIFAEPATITGSIGVFGTIPNIEGLAKKWGINAEQVQTNAQSTGYSVFEPMDDNFREFVKGGIEDVYQTFLQRVADGRNMPVASVDSIAQGRVWSGAEAVKLGLVDELGGLDDAIAYAAKLGKVTDYSTVSYPVYETSFDDIFGQFIGVKVKQTKEEILAEELGPEALQLLKKIKTLSLQKGIQARLPFEINIH